MLYEVITTYAAIFTGGTATYRSSTGTIDLTDANGTVLDTVEGAGRPTVINSVWGFMAHNTAELNVLDNTEVNAEEAIFLHKAGAATILVITSYSIHYTKLYDTLPRRSCKSDRPVMESSSQLRESVRSSSASFFQRTAV